MAPDPWDIPPFAGHGDKTPDQTYEAVGRALSSWEELEVSLSYLYGVFTEKGLPPFESHAEYGKPLIFSARADGLERMAARYFVRHPNQQREAEFARLICDVGRFSARRNDIAHGIVRPVVVGPPISVPDNDPSEAPWLRMNYEYCLLPPTYSDRRFHAKRTPQYALPAEEIIRFQTEFVKLHGRSTRLGFRLQAAATPSP